MSLKDGGKIAEVDKEKCIGCGACVITDPDVFEINSQGKSQIKENAKLRDENLILKAAQACPVKAIKVWNKARDQIYPLTNSSQ